MAAEMARWRSAMGALAGPPAANTHHAAGADPWLAASPSEVMHDASVREGSNLLPSAAPLPRIGSSLPAAAQAARRGGGGWDAAPRAAAAAQREARPGATAAELAGRNGSDEGVSGDRRCWTLRVLFLRHLRCSTILLCVAHRHTLGLSHGQLLAEGYGQRRHFTACQCARDW